MVKTPRKSKVPGKKRGPKPGPRPGTYRLPPDFPKLGKTIKTVARFTEAISAALLAGEMSQGIGRELNATARTQLISIRTAAGMHELDTLRGMLQKALTVRASQVAASVQSRYSADGVTAEFATDGDGGEQN